MASLDIKKKYYIEIFITLIFIADLFLKVLPVIPLGLLIALYVVFRSNNYERVFLFLIYYPFYVGAFMNTVGMNGVGGWFNIIGALMIAYMMVSGQKPIRKAESSILSFLALLSLFAISVFTTAGGDAAVPKLTNTFIQGSLYLVAFLVFYSNHERFDTFKIGVFYIMMSAIILRLSIITDQIPGPAGLADIGFLKNQRPSEEDVEGFVIGYQNLGFMCVQGMGFFLMTFRNKIDFEKILILLLGALVVLYAGSRQAIVTAVFIFAIWFLQLRFAKKSGSLILIAVGVMVIYYLAQLLLGDEGLFSSVADQGYVEGGGRGPWLLRGIELFLDHPWWGVGFGRYNLWGVYDTYPHNIIIEILCEMGILGFVAVLFISMRSILKNKAAFSYVLYLFIAMFLRAMASGGMSQNIILFTMLFALPSLRLSSSKSLDKNRATFENTDHLV